jgi:hypothetical protein
MMPGPKGGINLKFKDCVLNVSGINRGWGFNRGIPINEFEGREVQLRVINELFARAFNSKKLIRILLFYITKIHQGYISQIHDFS